MRSRTRTFVFDMSITFTQYHFSRAGISSRAAGIFCERKRQVFCGTEAGGWSAILAQADQPPCNHVAFCASFDWVRGQLQCIPSSPKL